MADTDVGEQWPREEFNALHAQSLKGNWREIERILTLQGCAHINIGCQRRGFTPLIYAAMSGVLRAVKILLDNGANVSAVGDGGKTALICTVERGHLDTAKMLIQADSDLEATDSDGNRPLHLAADTENTAVMTELVRAGANFYSRGNMGQTPIFISARTGNLLGLKMLLDAGAHAWGYDGRNIPLNHAALAGKTEVVRELVIRGGIKRWERGGLDALEIAAHCERLEILEVLTSTGVMDDGTALSSAVANGCGASAQFLLQHQGKTNDGRPYVDNSTTIDGRTPLALCFGPGAGFSGCKMAQMLIAHGADTTSNIPLRGCAQTTPLETIDKLATRVPLPQRLRNKGIRRLLLQVQAVRAVSWAWPVDLPAPPAPRIWPRVPKDAAVRVPQLGGTTTSPMMLVLQTTKSRASKSKVLLAAQIRYNGKLDAPFLGYRETDETDEQGHSADMGLNTRFPDG